MQTPYELEIRFRTGFWTSVRFNEGYFVCITDTFSAIFLAAASFEFDRQ